MCIRDRPYHYSFIYKIPSHQSSDVVLHDPNSFRYRIDNDSMGWVVWPEYADISQIVWLLVFKLLCFFHILCHLERGERVHNLKTKLSRYAALICLWLLFNVLNQLHVLNVVFSVMDAHVDVCVWECVCDTPSTDLRHHSFWRKVPESDARSVCVLLTDCSV